MATFRIVELEGRKYAIQKRQGFSWKGCSRYEDYVWHVKEHIVEYCIMNSLKKAEEGMEKILAEIKAKNTKLPRVVKVIRIMKA